MRVCHSIALSAEELHKLITTTDCINLPKWEDIKARLGEDVCSHEPELRFAWHDPLTVHSTSNK